MCRVRYQRDQWPRVCTFTGRRLCTLLLLEIRSRARITSDEKSGYFSRNAHRPNDISSGTKRKKGKVNTTWKERDTSFPFYSSLFAIESADVAPGPIENRARAINQLQQSPQMTARAGGIARDTSGLSNLLVKAGAHGGKIRRMPASQCPAVIYRFHVSPMVIVNLSATCQVSPELSYDFL